MERRYVIIELGDAKRLAVYARLHANDPDVLRVVSRLENETGADIEDIVAQLKGLPICHACVVESQERYCYSLTANKLGRRVARLVERALRR